MKECVTTTTAAVLVNGSPTDNFPLARGLRQEDLISPFLFLFAAEGFHVMMESMVTNNIFSGYKVGRERTLTIYHLQIADDSLLLEERSWTNVQDMHVVLYLFAAMSGFKVNFHKSMLVGVNVSRS